MVILSYSSTKNYLRCKRKFYWANIRKLEPVELPQKVELGKQASVALLHLYRGILQLDPIIDSFGSKTIDELQLSKDYLSLIGFMKAFKEYNATAGEPEVEWFIDLNENTKIHGFIDLVTPEHNLVEFKLTSSPDYYNSFTLRDQVGLYSFTGKYGSINIVLLQLPKIRASNTMYAKLYVDRIYGLTKNNPEKYITVKTYYPFEFLPFKQEILDKFSKISEEIATLGNDITNYYQNIMPDCMDCSYYPICMSGGIPVNLYTRRENQ